VSAFRKFCSVVFKIRNEPVDLLFTSRNTKLIKSNKGAGEEPHDIETNSGQEKMRILFYMDILLQYVNRLNTSNSHFMVLYGLLHKLRRVNT